MAFNLNKNEHNTAPTASKPKFELSKNNLAPNETGKAKGKSYGTLIYLIVALLLFSGSALYFISGALLPADRKTEMADNLKTNKPSIKISSKSTVSPSVSAVNEQKNIPVSFASGAITFRTLDHSVADSLISSLVRNPELSAYIYGYASSEGPGSVNLSISRARAEAFRAYLIAQGISGERLIAQGKGVENPVASNRTENGRKKNRRVEVRFFQKNPYTH